MNNTVYEVVFLDSDRLLYDDDRQGISEFMFRRISKDGVSIDQDKHTITITDYDGAIYKFKTDFIDLKEIESNIHKEGLRYATSLFQ